MPEKTSKPPEGGQTPRRSPASGLREGSDARASAIRIDFTNVTAASVGKKDGIAPSEIKAFEKKAVACHKQLLADRKSGKIGFWDLPYQKALVSDINGTVSELKGRCENFVVLGIGGSALGNIALQAALNHPFYNLLDRQARGGFPRIFIMDNVDPEYFAGLLNVIKPEETIFNIISKSGGTAEPMSQFMVIRRILDERLGGKAPEHIIATTDKAKGLLREIVGNEGFESFVVPDNVGGRFSVMTPVGLLSAAMGGIDIGQLLDGAAAMDKRCATALLMKNPTYLNSVIHHIADAKKGKSMSVMMPYSNALYLIADWYRQLWAESLGKKFNLKGKTIHTGQTPIKALGATDQHSQVQLYTEGPNDKIFTLVGVDCYRHEVAIPKIYEKYDDLEYLGGKTMNALIDAERVGTTIALTDARRPNLTVTLPEITAHTVGQMLQMYMIQTAFSGQLYGINAFDQPGVEAGKIAAFTLMGHKKYAAKRREVVKKIHPDKHWTL
jgi:glucose-6-phosphate isomerase